ncbi:B3 domain-containing protein Os07g0679700-like isoform X2 [Phoenix dactylifera]|uniref:B3 domain-containing protein Os07g0679700-like isoform X2 n=1 Tax=Phoenix dactylifera TaxID=42345 RepID=A0A8B7MT27_PHODC|nr:B3 domain-containing protein Os07g0679700-like isoform X2 [Phoenix dactylifera]XP_017697080.2 B3 domain-containing protein Os07g0679700-like isoform X2 [Phoenix dactylifera]XP_017697081.2 B3 domain-containing protein Os07g0679700-like isoform X2 [Phoenix dactylifera]
MGAEIGWIRKPLQQMRKQSGWRECFFCGKHLHCGCIASKFSFDLLDNGGVQCISCLKNSEISFVSSEVVQKFLPQHNQRLLVGSECDLSTSSAEAKMDDSAVGKGKAVMQLGRNNDTNELRIVPLEQREGENGSSQHIRWDHLASNAGEVGRLSFSSRNQGAAGSSQMSQQHDMISESLAQACLSMTLGTSDAERPLMVLPPANALAEGGDLNKASSAFQQVQRARQFLPRLPKAGSGATPEASKDGFSHMRVARPPAEGRGRNQLLPRYWPRITDQELQQISGDANSTIVPLFEKVLSASDAGRIGRLVLPKACAEAYFPPISQPEGLPLTIQDAKGKEWHFQFRFWPNNNSRMYVLEGVTPCIQSLQLQAGDTVTFSRIDPEGKLVMGYRKATNTVPLPDSQISAIANSAVGNETFLPGVNENLPIASGYPGLLLSYHQTDKHGGRPNEGLQLQPVQKRSRNIGAKCRRLLMDSEDALELTLTWEEAQNLLRPAPNSRPSVVMIDDHEIEEYDEPPVLGKKTIYTARLTGERDQWIQCDDCSKWRRLPVDVLVPSKWTCADNTWDPKRSSCHAPEELSQKDLQSLLRQYADYRRQQTNVKQHFPELDASSGLDALANAAALGDVGNQTTSSVATTTKHPRHRPGCTCIVCIQPPSGKGPKHSPTCTCNVCLTVKRRFKTLMMRKKKRQSEREEAEAQKRLAWGNKEELEGSSLSRNVQPLDVHREYELGQGPGYNRAIIEKLDISKGRIDLNCHPGRDEVPQAGRPQQSMMSLLQEANLPLEVYLKQTGLTSLVGEQGSSSSLTIPQGPAESEGRTPDESHFASVAQERDAGADEGYNSPDKARSDAA